MMAGAAGVVITPPLDTLLAGTSEPDRRAEYVLDDLTANALVLALDGHKQALVSCDVLFLSDASVARIRAAVARATDVPPEQVVVTATHTHCGPVTIPYRGFPVDATVLANLEQAVAGAVLAANRTLVPVRIGSGSGSEPDLTFNRRVIGRDGRVLMPTMDGPNIIGNIRDIEGPIDPEVGVVKVERLDGSLLAVLWNYALHCDLPTGRRYSADFPGVVRRTLRRIKGDDLVVLFAPGACGDLEHLNPREPADLKIYRRFWDPAGEAQMLRWGLALAGTVLNVLEKTRAQAVQRLALGRRTIEIRRRGAPAEAVDHARAVLAAGEAAEFRERLYAQDTLRLAELAGRVEALELSVQVLGDTAWVGVPAELFCQLGLGIKRGSPFRHTYIAELSNGWQGYIPTRLAFANGGYEASPAAHSTSFLVPEAGEMVVQHCLELLNELGNG